MNQILLWLDNPILVKHCRSRLRTLQMVSSIAVIAILALSAVLLGYSFDHLHGGATFGALLVLQSIVLGFMGASQVGTSVGKAREAGILDFHRTSPMSPLALTLGFFFGAPIREYAMFAATLPFSILCVIAGTPTPLGALQLIVPMVMGAWVLHAISLLGALAGKLTKSGTRGVMGRVIGVVVVLVLGGSGMLAGIPGAARAIGETPTIAFFGIELPWLVVLALYQLPVIGFLLVGSTRKMASERAHILSKPQAVACLGTAAVLTLGGTWGLTSGGYYTMVVLYCLVVGAIVMASTVTPGLDEFAKGIRKASKEGQKYPATWSDRGLNRVVVFCLALVVLAATTVLWKVIEEPAWTAGRSFQLTPINYSLPIAIGVLTVSYFGLALQFFQLRFGKRGTTFFALFLFTTWLVPLIAGAVAGMAAASNWAPGAEANVWPSALAALSPVSGIALSGTSGGPSRSDWVPGCALVPALCFALLFNNLVTTARRRIQKQIHPEAFPEPGAKGKDKAGTDEVAEAVGAV